MHTRVRVRTALTATSLAALAGLTACGGNGTTTDTTPADKPAATEEATTKAETALLPDLTGKGLQAAQDQAQEAGFYNLTSHDALGRARMQAFDRNWKVCFQEPQAGEQPTDTEVDLGAVKLKETCPSSDQSADSETAGSTMPDFKGKSVKAAREALPSNASITVTDASGADRIVLVESNWQVCTQDPTAGTKLDGLPVTFTAVKFGETC